MTNAESVATFLRGLQDRICSELEAVDGQGRFFEDAWTRAEGGGGRSRVLKQGAVFEQAGVGLSGVPGATLPAAARAHRPELAGRALRPAGGSCGVLPPEPYVPTHDHD